MLTNQAAPQAWPITGATFILMYGKPENPANAAQTLRFFHWGLTQGNAMASELGYATLPANVVGSIEKLWTQVRDASGKPVAYR
jgi:phosphate transport system substrate-binding protein